MAFDSFVDIIQHDGRKYYTGLLQPTRQIEVLAAAKPRVADVMRLLSRDDAIDLLSAANRIPARQEFPAIDWINNQGNRSSCNGHAATGTLRRARKRAGRQDVRLSPSYVYAGINGGLDQGSHLLAALEWLTGEGAPPWDLCDPMLYQWSKISTQAKAEAKRFRGFEYWRIDSEEELWTCVALGHPVEVAVHAGSNFMRLDAEGVAGVDNGRGNHAVLVHDAKWSGKRKRMLYDHAGSWGLSYGQDGHAWLAFDSFAQTIRTHAFWAFRCVEDDPKEQGPVLAA